MMISNSSNRSISQMGDNDSLWALPTEIRDWIVSAARAGYSGTYLLEQLASSGWPESLAIQTLQSILPCESISPLTRNDLSARHHLPELDIVPLSPFVSAGDREVRILLTVGNPRIVLLANLLSAEECEELIELAQNRMDRSRTVDRRTGAQVIHPARTSVGMFFTRGQNELVSRIEERIASLVHWPVENGEGLQVLRYGPGEEYKPHYDYFTPDEPATQAILKRGGQRVASLILYLNAPEKGGGTLFADIGLEVAPQAGHAVFFSYAAHPSSRSLHGGSPVIAGEKWIATKWLREQAHQ